MPTQASSPASGEFPAARVGDEDSHKGTIGTGSLNVLIEGVPAARKGDPLGPCAKPIAEGSPTVFINGFAAARFSDPTGCGGTIATSALRTFIGNGKG